MIIIQEVLFIVVVMDIWAAPWSLILLKVAAIVIELSPNPGGPGPIRVSSQSWPCPSQVKSMNAPVHCIKNDEFLAVFGELLSVKMMNPWSKCEFPSFFRPGTMPFDFAGLPSGCNLWNGLIQLS